MAVVVHIDETGEPGLEKIDPGFPVFVLTMCICDQSVYRENIIPAFNAFKFEHWGHEGIIFHYSEALVLSEYVVRWVESMLSGRPGEQSSS